MELIHPTAIVDPAAKLSENVTVGPYAIIEGDVEIGEGSIIGPHACIYNGARVGKNVQIFQFLTYFFLSPTFFSSFFERK